MTRACDTEFVALDFETANASRDSACSLGLVKCRGREIVAVDSFLIRPKVNVFCSFNTAIHGITAAQVEDEPTFDALWERFTAFVGDAPLVAHNASFDMSVLRGLLDSYGIACPSLSYACSVQISKRTWPDLPRYKLSVVAGHLGIDFVHHDALEDASACARIALAAMDIHGAAGLIPLAEGLGIRPGRLFPGGYVSSSMSRSVGRKGRPVALAPDAS